MVYNFKTMVRRTRSQYGRVVKATDLNPQVHLLCIARVGSNPAVDVPLVF